MATGGLKDELHRVAGAKNLTQDDAIPTKLHLKASVR
jgi:hypothetical protein